MEGGDSGSHTSQGDRHLTTQPHTWLSDLQGPTAVHFADVILSKALVHSRVPHHGRGDGHCAASVELLSTVVPGDGGGWGACYLTGEGDLSAC